MSFPIHEIFDSPSYSVTSRQLQQLGQQASNGEGGDAAYFTLILVIFIGAVLLFCGVLILSTIRRSEGNQHAANIARIERLMSALSEHSMRGVWLSNTTAEVKLHIEASFKIVSSRAVIKNWCLQ